MDIKDEIVRRKKDAWYEVIFNIEALGTTEDIVNASLRDHVEKMSRVRDVLIYEKEFSELRKVMNPMKHIAEAYSQIVRLKFFAKDLKTLLNVTLAYGPSSIEVLGPHKKDVEMGEIQDVANNLAGLVHQFAAAGLGGILISPDEKKKH